MVQVPFGVHSPVGHTALCARPPTSLLLDCVPGPRSRGAWLSVQTRLTLNKFQYTLYKEARSFPHLTNQPLWQKKAPLGPLCIRGTSVGRRGRGMNGLVPTWPAMSMHKAIVATRGISGTPSRPGREEKDVASGRCAPSEPAWPPPWLLQP